MDESIQTKQYLTFTLNNELFALSIQEIREVLEYTSIRKIPQTPEYMKGVINLRGAVVPVLDMRLKMGMTEGDITIDTCIIIIETGNVNDKLTFGVMVDSVKEVIELSKEQLEAPPNMGFNFNTDYIEWMAKKEDAFIIILNLGKVFAGAELSNMTF